MQSVSNILKTKGSATISVTPETIVYDAIELMCDRNVSSVVIMENERLVGIFTERDYARKLILQGKASKETRISEVMTEDLVTVTLNTTIEECMQLMTSRFIRHLPVLEGNRLLGIISIGDVVKSVIEEQKFIIENMEHFISGS
jgi:CBS domain-containing protein